MITGGLQLNGYSVILVSKNGSTGIFTTLGKNREAQRQRGKKWIPVYHIQSRYYENVNNADLIIEFLDRNTIFGI